MIRRRVSRRESAHILRPLAAKKGSVRVASSYSRDVMDMEKLNDDEIEFALERILKKTEVEPDGDETPLFIIERVFVDAAEPTDDANHVER
jgi:hypothetical protein